ncbi:hypothetical protein KHQ82_03410 [Mycoplasmatota bacterium]|nr:hypothetical protein KHQ82_03410 [Mycoplasmatota bacterium]
MKKQDYISAINSTYTNYIKSAKIISYDDTNDVYVTSLLKEFWEFDKISQRDHNGVRSVDTVIINNDLFLIEFKNTRSLKSANIRQKYFDTFIVLLESYYKMLSSKIHIDTFLQSFDSVNVIVVNSQYRPSHSATLDEYRRRYEILFPKIKNLIFDAMDPEDFTNRFSEFDYATHCY